MAWFGSKKKSRKNVIEKIEQLLYEHEKHDNADALQKAISLCQENGISPEEAREIKIDMLFKMAEKGDAFAQRCIGEEFLFNNQDPEKAFFWLNLAAEQGDDKAMVDIASGYSSLLNEEPKRMFGENLARNSNGTLKPLNWEMLWACGGYPMHIKTAAG